MLEHYAGELPVWLAPIQVIVLPISDRSVEYAREVHERLREAGVRAELDERGESVARKIREAELRKISRMLIVGEREAAERTVSVREHGAGDQGVISLEEAVRLYSAELKPRIHSPHSA
jgi:threonyl-tRNA synthetase